MKRREKAGKAQLFLFRGDGSLLFAGPTVEIPLPDAAIAKLSDYFFSDPEPCQLNISAVRARVSMEIETHMEPGRRYPLNSLPAPAGEYCGYCGAEGAMLVWDCQP